MQTPTTLTVSWSWLCYNFFSAVKILVAFFEQEVFFTFHQNIFYFSNIYKQKCCLRDLLDGIHKEGA